MKAKKVVLYLTEEDRLVHLCYVEEDLLLKAREIPGFNILELLKGHIVYEFGEMVTNTRQLEQFKEYIQDWAKRVFPDLYLESSYDRQGWMRVWVTSKIKECIEDEGSKL